MSVEEAVRSAAAAAAAAAGRGRTDKDIAALVEKFGRHPNGYLHARVVIDGRTYYFHRKYGSWLAPGSFRGRELLKEPEGLLGSALGTEIKYELSRRSAPFEAERRRQEEEAARNASETASGAEGRRGDGAPSDPDRIPGAGDSERTPGPVSDDGA